VVLVHVMVVSLLLVVEKRVLGMLVPCRHSQYKRCVMRRVCGNLTD
jgi:hypothetical protein